MNVRKFTAATTRDALQQVKEEMGDNAVILSNRKVQGGVEIMAMTDQALTDITGTHAAMAEAAETRVANLPELSAETDVYSVPKKPAQPVFGASTLQARREMRPEPAKIAKPVRINPARAAASPAAEPVSLPAAAPAPAPAITPHDQQVLVKEIKSMRNMLQEQFNNLSWSDMQQRDPKRSKLLRNLVNAGFSTALAHKFLEKMPANADMAWINQVLTHNLRVATQAEDVVVRGGVYALIGPTGVGKTTTTAKLAARAVVRYGADSVALITTDSYRIGALEQLRIYGKILGVAVHAARDTSDLRITLSGLKHKRLVLIDTMGMGQRDKRLAEQAAMFDAAGVQRLLLLNSTSSGDTLDDVVRQYNGSGVIGCIATKLDEAATMGAALDVMVRHRLPLHYVANGQRVPEDLHEVNMAYLLHRTFESTSKPPAFAMQELDIPALMAGHAAVSSVRSEHAF